MTFLRCKYSKIFILYSLVAMVSSTLPGLEDQLLGSYFDDKYIDGTGVAESSKIITVPYSVSYSNVHHGIHSNPSISRTKKIHLSSRLQESPNTGNSLRISFLNQRPIIMEHLKQVLNPSLQTLQGESSLPKKKVPRKPSMDHNDQSEEDQSESHRNVDEKKTKVYSRAKNEKDDIDQSEDQPELLQKVNVQEKKVLLSPSFEKDNDQSDEDQSKSTRKVDETKKKLPRLSSITEDDIDQPEYQPELPTKVNVQETKVLRRPSFANDFDRSDKDQSELPREVDEKEKKIHRKPSIAKDDIGESEEDQLELLKKLNVQKSEVPRRSSIADDTNRSEEYQTESAQIKAGQRDRKVGKKSTAQKSSHSSWKSEIENDAEENINMNNATTGRRYISKPHKRTCRHKLANSAYKRPDNRFTLLDSRLREDNRED